MSGQRVDTIDRYFLPVKSLEKVSTFLFWINVLLSICIVFLEDYPAFKAWVNGAFIVVTLSYTAVTLALGLWVLPKAQMHRSTHLIVDALGVALDNEVTNQYYNNPQRPSVTRLGMNVFENSLFSWRISERMLIIERTKILIYIIAWLLLVLPRTTSLDLIAAGAQALFASALLSDYLRLEIARIQFHSVYKDSWHLFLNGIPDTNNATTTGVILNLAMRYECIKSSMTVSLDSKIFTKINDEVTREWEQIKSRLHINDT